MLEVRSELPSIGGSITITYGTQQDPQAERFVHTGEVPKEIMDAYQELIGDANAKVTVGADLAVKDFGTGAGAFVSVSLTCNQDVNTVNMAISLAAAAAQQAAAHYQPQGAETAKRLDAAQKSSRPPGR